MIYYFELLSSVSNKKFISLTNIWAKDARARATYKYFTTWLHEIELWYLQSNVFVSQFLLNIFGEFLLTKIYIYKTSPNTHCHCVWEKKEKKLPMTVANRSIKMKFVCPTLAHWKCANNKREITKNTALFLLFFEHYLYEITIFFFSEQKSYKTSLDELNQQNRWASVAAATATQELTKLSNDLHYFDEFAFWPLLLLLLRT